MKYLFLTLLLFSLSDFGEARFVGRSIDLHPNYEGDHYHQFDCPNDTYGRVINCTAFEYTRSKDGGSSDWDATSNNYSHCVTRFFLRVTLSGDQGSADD